MIPVSYDGNNINDGTNYESLIELDGYGLPLVDIVTARRHGAWPIIGGIKRDEKRISLQVFIRGASVATLRKQLFQYFDYEDETPKPFIVEDYGGGNDRYVMAICRGIFPDEIAPETCYHVALVVDGDVRWRETSITTASAWSVTATGQTKVVANGGQDKAFPIFKIEPTDARTGGGFNYKIYSTITWRSENSATNYPVDVLSNNLDTDALTTAKMQADGDDLRVYVDGVEVDRWLQDMDTVSTQAWVNLDFEAEIDMSLDGGISDADTKLVVAESIDKMPSSGVLHIQSETIAYSGKSNPKKEFSGLTRGTRGTSAAAHTDGVSTYWIQHDVWVYYGDSTLSAPVVDDDYKPMFLLSSTNASWVYANFMETAKPNRPGSWRQRHLGSLVDFYGGTQGAAADPFEELGIHTTIQSHGGLFYMGNPCGINAANLTNGEHYHVVATIFQGEILSNPDPGGNPDLWVSEYTIPDPGDDATWDTWSRNETLDSGSKAVGLYNWGWSNHASYLEVADVTLTLNNSYTPSVLMSAEQSNYTLSCIITNNTTGDAIEINYDMALNEEFEVNTDEKTVIDLEENINKFNALGLVGGARVKWLPLDVGNNTLQLDDTGTGDLTITVTWWERYYE